MADRVGEVGGGGLAVGIGWILLGGVRAGSGGGVGGGAGGGGGVGGKITLR